MASLPIPDELVAEIFLRLPTPADLVRASAACASFRRVVSGRSFPRRFRKLHARPLLGFLDRCKVFHPAIAPHPSASAASAVALAADFSFSFLPGPSRDWIILDSLDGRVLLYKRMRVYPDESDIFDDMVVCDPLHQQYLLLPAITSDLAASVDDALWSTMYHLETFLVPPGDEAEETSFKVIWMGNSETRPVAFLFSSDTGQWGAIPSRPWSDLSAGLPPMTANVRHYLRQYVYGCFYWYWTTADCGGDKLLVLDTKTMEFSVSKPPLEAHGCFDLAMVEAGEGRPGMFVLGDSASDLSYFIRRNSGGSSSEWQKVKTISLGSRANLTRNREKYLVLYQGQSSLLEEGYFTLDIETFQLERACYVSPIFGTKMLAYCNFLPSLLSSPTISSGVENKAEKEMLEQGSAAGSSAESLRSG